MTHSDGGGLVAVDGTDSGGAISPPPPPTKQHSGLFQGTIRAMSRRRNSDQVPSSSSAAAVASALNGGGGGGVTITVPTEELPRSANPLMNYFAARRWSVKSLDKDRDDDGGGEGGGGGGPSSPKTKCVAPTCIPAPAYMRERWTNALEEILSPGCGGNLTVTAEQTMALAELHEWLLRQSPPPTARSLQLQQQQQQQQRRSPPGGNNGGDDGDGGGTGDGGGRTAAATRRLLGGHSILNRRASDPGFNVAGEFPSRCGAGGAAGGIAGAGGMRRESADGVVFPTAAPAIRVLRRRMSTLSNHGTNVRGQPPAISVPANIIEWAETGDDTGKYLAAEYGGLMVTRKKDLIQKFKAATQARIFLNRLNNSVGGSLVDVADEPDAYVPPEWTKLSDDEKVRARDLLSWDSLGRWGGFDIFELAEITGGNPLLFVGWAILGSPGAQRAMSKDLAASAASASGEEGDGRSGEEGDGYRGSPVIEEKKGTTDASSTPNQDPPADGADDVEQRGYGFATEYSVRPKLLCNFLRSIESDYDDANPYHNSTHAADVLQSTHVLLSTMGGMAFAKSSLEPFALLLAAAIHDVGHPGQNNAYQVHARTEHAIAYNDSSPLENMHLSKAFGRLLGDGKQRHMDVLRGLDEEKLDQVRADVIAAVLETDFAMHFDLVTEMRDCVAAATGNVTDGDSVVGGDGDDGSGVVGGVGVVDPELFKSEDDGSPAKRVLRLIVHMADISAQGKPGRLSAEWSDRVYDEFFAQGDMEAKRGLPISPLCDRKTTLRASSQVGFVRYVVKPAFEVLGSILPRVRTEVLPILEDNLSYWERKGKEEKEEERVRKAKEKEREVREEEERERKKLEERRKA